MAGLSINTDINSLVSNHAIRATSSRLNTTMTQLSTGYRINAAKDDPAGLIASELMRSDITATRAAIKNTQAADRTLSIAESGMKQISSLLEDARGLAVASANTGAISSGELAANQQSMDQILNSIDRITNTTRMMGRKLIDGSQSAANGGLTFQIGTEVNSGGQINVAIPNMGTSGLGNSSGLLMDLRSGGKASLETDPALADSVIRSATTAVAMERGRLGSIQKSTLAPTIGALETSLVQTIGAESQIRDTDFALAASNLVRDQILMQAGLKTSALTNQNRRYAASLLDL